MASKKPKVLLVWGYHRKGWIEPFEKLKEDIDFVYMHYLRKPENEVSFTDCPTYYWMDFKSPYEIISTIKPDKVVFMSIDRSNSIALNIACKYKGIHTFVFQHGIFYTFDWYVENNKKEIERFKSLGQDKWGDELQTNDQLALLKFMLRSMRWNFIPVFAFIIRFIRLKRKFGKNLQLFLHALHSDYLNPTKYLVFTKENAQIFVERNFAKAESLVEIGNPFIDDYFDVSETEKENYFLLIDEPLAYVGDFNSEGFFSKESVITYQRKLNDYAKSKGNKLIIKLHPYSYDNDFYLQDDNIVYIKDADIPPLIHKAQGIFGTSSTLLIPSVFVNKCVIFNIWEFSEFEEDCEKWGLIQKLDFHNFDIAEINFDTFTKTDENLQKMIRKYMYKIDGKATQRLKEALLTQ